MFPLQEHVPAWLMLQLVLRLSIILVLNLQQLLFSLKNIISDSEEMSLFPILLSHNGSSNYTDTS